jgi:hypothetical protein
MLENGACFLIYDLVPISPPAIGNAAAGSATRIINSPPQGGIFRKPFSRYLRECGYVLCMVAFASFPGLPAKQRVARQAIPS